MELGTKMDFEVLTGSKKWNLEHNWILE